MTQAETALTSRIASLLQANWLEQQPTDQCFDNSAENFNRVEAFIQGHMKSDESSVIRNHLVDCPRCRFIYSTLRSTAEPSCSSVPDVLREQLHTYGPVIFPGGETAEETWEFGLLDELPRQKSEQIIEAITDEAVAKLKGLIRHGAIIVCFGTPIHRCGKRLAAKLTKAGVKDIHIVMADDFFNPKLWCDPKELRGKQVFVFVDVVHSGGLIRRICDAARLAEPEEIVGLTVIDQSLEASLNVTLVSLWKEPPEKRSLQVFPHDRFEHPRFFDPVHSRARPSANTAKEVLGRETARTTIEQYLRELGPLFGYIAETDALQSDKVIAGVCYPWVINILNLLAYEPARNELVARATTCLKSLSECGSWCLVYPAERSKRAGIWAKAIGRQLGWPVISIGLSNRRHFRPLTERQRSELEKYSGAVVVDAAIRTGKTLQSFVRILAGDDSPLVKQLIPFYAFDGLFAEDREELEQQTRTSIQSLFRLPLGAPTDPVSKHCRRYFADALQTLPDAKADSWIGVVKAYCKKKLAVYHYASAVSQIGVEQGLLRAIDETERGVRAKLERTCTNPRPSMVKHLDVSYALQEPRTRNVLHGFLCNSMPNEFIEWCALALSTQNDYEWFDTDWLTLHEQLIKNPKSERWQFLAFIGYRMRQQGDGELVSRACNEIEQFRKSQQPSSPMLFPDADEEMALIESRCNTLLGALA